MCGMDMLIAENSNCCVLPVELWSLYFFSEMVLAAFIVHELLAAHVLHLYNSLFRESCSLVRCLQGLSQMGAWYACAN